MKPLKPKSCYYHPSASLVIIALTFFQQLTNHAETKRPRRHAILVTDHRPFEERFNLTLNRVIVVNSMRRVICTMYGTDHIKHQLREFEPCHLSNKDNVGASGELLPRSLPQHPV